MSVNNGTPSGVNNNVCAVCKIVARQVCGGCKNVHYCSREHQKSDWKNHSKNCRVFELVQDSTIGHYNISKRKINLDDLIMTENKAIMVTPVIGSGAVCLNCYVPLTMYNGKPCARCGWPLCPECTTHGPECELTMKYRKTKVIIEDYSNQNEIFTSIVVMRAIALRESNPEAYKKLLSLMLALNECFTNSIPLLCYHVSAEATIKCIKIDDLDIAEMVTIIAVVALRGFGTKNPKGNIYFAIFDEPSYNAHDCRANSRCETFYDDVNGARIAVRAVRPIEKGEPITVSFTSPLLGTARRRTSLRGSKFLECTCERCSDPTDLGTMYNAIKCIKKECTGYMLPRTFVVSEDEKIPDYVCDKCSAKISSDVIDELMEDISIKFSRIDQKNAKELENFVANESKILHENHFHIFTAQLKLAAVYNCTGMNADFITEKFLREIRAACKKMTFLITTLAPDEYLLRGMILSAQYRSMLDLVHYLTRSERIGIFEESFKILHEINRLLRHVNNGELAEQSQAQLTQLNAARSYYVIHDLLSSGYSGTV